MSLLFKILFVACLPIILAYQRSSDTVLQESGKELYEKNCKFCHGPKGNRTLGGSKKISESLLTKEERIKIISKGSDKMNGFEDQLDQNQINMIAEYTLTLSRNHERR